MAGTAKAQDKGRDSRREGATALDAVKTKAKVEAASAGREADGRAAEASKPARAGSGDSPKRQGDKLEKAREAAAGRSGRK